MSRLTVTTESRRSSGLPSDSGRVTLRLRYPRSGLVQEQEFDRDDRAVAAAYAHFASFPTGLAQIYDGAGEILYSHVELRELHDRRRK